MTKNFEVYRGFYVKMSPLGFRARVSLIGSLLAHSSDWVSRLRLLDALCSDALQSMATLPEERHSCRTR